MNSIARMEGPLSCPICICCFFCGSLSPATALILPRRAWHSGDSFTNFVQESAFFANRNYYDSIEIGNSIRTVGLSGTVNRSAENCPVCGALLHAPVHAPDVCHKKETLQEPLIVPPSFGLRQRSKAQLPLSFELLDGHPRASPSCKSGESLGSSLHSKMLAHSQRSSQVRSPTRAQLRAIATNQAALRR